MKKTISFEKKQVFPTMIGEISAISLEHDLKFLDEYNISGNLILLGKYKLTEASRLEEEFTYKFPIEITLTEKIVINTSNISITDFSYEIENNDTIICHIEIEISGKEIKEELLEENRECDGEVLEQEVEIPILNQVNNKEDTNKNDDNEKTITDITTTKEQESVTTNQSKDNNSDFLNTKEENIFDKKEEKKESSFFIDIEDDKETYGTFIVYMVNQNETINSIIEKYQTTKEELEQYNNLDSLTTGTKLIIPYKHD